MPGCLSHFCASPAGGWVGAAGFVSASDARYKKNIVTLENPLDSLLRLRGVSYEWRKDEFERMNFADGKQLGFIAQELETVFPELVSTDANGYKSVNYLEVVHVLVEAIKTQQKQIESLTAKVNALETENARIGTLEKRLAELADTIKRTQTPTKRKGLENK